MLCEFETSEYLPATHREALKGTPTSQKARVNYYGTVRNEQLTFPVSFVKITGKPFTKNERHLIENWLYGTDIPSELIFIDSMGEQSSFDCIVTGVEWRLCGAMCIGATVTLESVSPYYYFKNEVEESITSFGYISAYNSSCEKFSYPRITITNIAGVDCTYKIRSDVDDNRTLTINIKSDSTVVLDSENCIVETGELYEDLGWDKIDYIYWPRLLQGDNKLYVEGGDVNIKLEYKQAIGGMGSFFGDIYRDTSGYARIEGDSLALYNLGDIENKKLVVTGTIADTTITL